MTEQEAHRVIHEFLVSCPKSSGIQSKAHELAEAILTMLFIQSQEREAAVMTRMALNQLVNQLKQIESEATSCSSLKIL